MSSVDEAETRLQQALLAADVDALDRLLHRDVVFVGPDGAEVDRAADLEAHRSGALQLREVDELSRVVREFGDAGVSRVRLHLTGEAAGSAVDVVMIYTRTWVREDGRWQVLQAQGALVQ